MQPSQTCSQWYLDAAPDGWVDVFEFDADTGDVINESSAIFCPSDVSSLIYSLSISICFRACDGRREVEDALPRYAASGQRIVLLAADGVASRSIGRAVGCTTGTASKWRVRYARKRLAGLGETGDGLTLYASMVLQPPFLQELMDYPVSTAGIVMGPRGIGTMISMLAVGRMVGHIDTRLLLGAGLAVMAWSFYAMTGWTPDVSQETIIGVGFVQGAGLGSVR